MSTKLYVGNLSYETTEASLTELFGAVGQVVSANIITDRLTGRPRGYGFVEMAEDSAAQQAISQLNDQVLDGRSIKVEEARPPRPRGQRDDWQGRGSRRY